MITSMCIDSQNPFNAATGSQNGKIRLFNLFTGECKFVLDNKVFNQISTCINNFTTGVNLQI